MSRDPKVAAREDLAERIYRAVFSLSDRELDAAFSGRVARGGDPVRRRVEAVLVAVEGKATLDYVGELIFRYEADRLDLVDPDGRSLLGSADETGDGGRLDDVVYDSFESLGERRENALGDAYRTFGRYRLRIERIPE